MAVSVLMVAVATMELLEPMEDMEQMVLLEFLVLVPPVLEEVANVEDMGKRDIQEGKEEMELKLVMSLSLFREIPMSSRLLEQATLLLI